MSVLAPLPLYSGTTLVSRHDCGASCLTALTLRKVDSPATPPAPRCFNSWSGSGLRPCDLLALKLRSRTSPSSAAPISATSASCTGWYWEVGPAGAANNYSLKAANWVRSTSPSACLPFFSIFQKVVGLYFNISGILRAKFHLAFLQVFIKSL